MRPHRALARSIETGAVGRICARGAEIVTTSSRAEIVTTLSLLESPPLRQPSPRLRLTSRRLGEAGVRRSFSEGGHKPPPPLLPKEIRGETQHQTSLRKTGAALKVQRIILRHLLLLLAQELPHYPVSAQAAGVVALREGSMSSSPRFPANRVVHQ